MNGHSIFEDLKALQKAVKNHGTHDIELTVPARGVGSALHHCKKIPSSAERKPRKIPEIPINRWLKAISAVGSDSREKELLIFLFQS